jgi:hypothetical protein
MVNFYDLSLFLNDKYDRNEKNINGNLSSWVPSVIWAIA